MVAKPNYNSGTCLLKFLPTSTGLEDLLSRTNVSEEEVARQQVEEDLRLYGSRPQPSDAVDLDEAVQIAALPPKRNASEFQAAVDRPAKVRKKEESKAFNYGTVTAIDWNSGASPLDAWLNQSAVPSTVVPQGPDQGDESFAQEAEEIKVFRHVHLTIKPESKNGGSVVDEVNGLDLAAQIYYRNIRDRYPLLPVYLARRLGQANHERSESLRSKRFESKPPNEVAVEAPIPSSSFGLVLSDRLGDGRAVGSGSAPQHCSCGFV